MRTCPRGLNPGWWWRYLSKAALLVVAFIASGAVLGFLIVLIRSLVRFIAKARYIRARFQTEKRPRAARTRDVQSSPSVGRLVGNAIGYAVFALLVVGFVLMAAGFARLVRQAWAMPDRKRALRRALTVLPRRTPGWPDTSAGAELIRRGAWCGVVSFVVLLAIALWPSGRSC